MPSYRESHVSGKGVPKAAFTRIQISGYLDIRMSKIRISWERLHVSDRNVFGVYTSPDIRMHYTRHTRYV